MSEFHDDYPQYELMAHHSEEDGKKKRRKLWNVFWIMLIVTIIELIIGFKASEWGLLNEDRTSSVVLKFIFIGLTIAKAYFIVMSFMHLGDEKKSIRRAILWPYTVFILYLVWICVQEANYAKIYKHEMDKLIVEQKARLNEEAKSGHHGAEHHDAAGAEHKDAAAGEHKEEAKPAEHH